MSYNFGYPPGVSIVDVVPAEIKSLVHPHWNKFPPVNPMWHYLLGVIYIFMGFMSFTGNGVVIYLYFKVKKLRTPANLLIINLAIMDFLMLLSQFPAFAYNCFMGGIWMFSAFACDLYCIFGAITGMGSLWSHVFITYDRYNVIVHGMNGKPLTMGKAIAMVIFTWIYAVGVSTPPLYGWGRYILEGILDSCSFDYLTRDFNNLSFGTFLFVFCYCFPLSCIIYAYFFIVKAVVAHESAMRAQAKKMNVANLRSGTEGESAEMRVAKTAICNVTVWLICWTPYCAIVVQGMWFDQDKITPIATMIPALLAKTCACYNPMVYALSHPRFRAAMQENVSFCCVHEPDGPGNAGAADGKSTGTEAAEK